MKAAVSSTQTICSHCEEVVHRYAVRCPYCNKNLKGQAAAPIHDMVPPETSQSKITQMPVSAVYAQDLFQDLPKAQMPFSKIEEEKLQSQQPQVCKEVCKEVRKEIDKDDTFGKEMRKVLVPLISLLAGSFFFFFGIILKLFSNDGTFTLAWNASSWPFFVFPAFFLLLVGMASLPKDTKDMS